jgi:prepilin-type N-terminal cleavage/methylation domain-containing protein
MNTIVERRAKSRPVTSNSRGGFTLVEMLVTLALTLIMMLLFAQIFQIAGNFVTRQKAIGENDQAARILTTALKTDLQARTMHFVAPFHPNMPLLSDDSKRQGYFYYSENNPLDDTDDVLQFTVNLTVLPSTNPLDNGQLYGAAANLPLPWQALTAYGPNTLVRPAGTTPNSLPTGFVYKTTAGLTSGGAEPTWSSGTPALGATFTDNGGTWVTVPSALDQPDGDDGVMSYVSPSGSETINPAGASPNSTGASQFAEVSYFLRHGNLYRRVLLIRNPYNTVGTTGNSQPVDTAGTSLIPSTYPPAGYINNFWNDFDFAARSLPVTTGGTGIAFLAQTPTESSLDNTDLTGTANYRIGRPDNRFGFDQVYATPALGTQTTNGAPREYAFPYNSATNMIIGGATPTPVFFGRYTHEETSNLNFLFPGALPLVPPGTGTPTSPMGWQSVLGLDSTSYTMWLLNGNPPTVASSWNFARGPRRGEDILLTNVISFDVKLWDNNYLETTGGIDVNRNGVIDAGPAFADVGHTASGDFMQSNNILSVYGPNVTTTYTAGTGPHWCTPDSTYTANGVTYNNNNVFDTWYRTFDYDNLSRTYDTADAALAYAPAPYRPRIGSAWAPGQAYPVGSAVYSTNTANGFSYVCTANTGDTKSGATDPFLMTNQVLNTITDNNVTWTVQAPPPVQAIQITVKYLDPTQNLLRQVTIVQSLVP